MRQIEEREEEREEQIKPRPADEVASLLLAK